MIQQRESHYLLKNACELIHSDIDKQISIDYIWDKTKTETWNKRLYGNIISDPYKKDYINNLEKEGFIRKIDDNHITITLNGIYFVADTFKESPENYGILNRKDFNYGLNYVMSLIKSNEGYPDKILISDIRRLYRGIGDMPFKHIIYVLEKKD